MSEESENLPLESIQRIDRLCDQYEEEWSSQQHTKLEEYLAQVPSAERGALFRALFKVEVELQNPEGLEQLAQELPQQFPEYQSTITKLITSASQYGKTEGDPSKVDQSDAFSDVADMNETEHPQKIDRYEIQKVLGEGGFGTVYEAHDPKLNRSVALKVPLPTTLKSKENLDRFVREAQIAASLYHPGICPIYDVAQQGKQTFIVMKCIEGSTMDEVFKRQSSNNRLMPIPKSVQLIRKIGEAIEYAHNKGVIHRDLKPSNIIWDKEHKAPVITDFGLARFWNSNESDLTATGQTMGTPAYIAPEQAIGKSKDLGRQVDVYSLGVIFYEILTGSRPFPGNSYDVVIQKSSEDPPAPSTHRVEIDSHLDAICLKAIARLPQQRYESVQELIDALGKYASSEDVSPSSQVLNVTEVESELKPISKNIQQRRTDQSKSKAGKSQKRKKVEIDPDYDPYYLWLGIPKERRPAAYHELLGIGVKEDDDQVIASAAKRQSLIVQPYLATEHESLAKQLLYEISEAKTVLSDPYLRMEYRKTLPKPQKRKPGYHGGGIPSEGTDHKPVGESSEFLRIYMGVMGCISFLILLAFVVSAYAPIWNEDGPDQEAAVERREAPNNPKQKDPQKENVAQEEPEEKVKEPEKVAEEVEMPEPVVEPTDWIDLLANFDLSKQRISGAWEFRKPTLSIVDHETSAAVRFLFEEQSNYELETTFSFTDNPSDMDADGILLVVPVGGKFVRLGVFHDWFDLVGLSLKQDELNYRVANYNTPNNWDFYYKNVKLGRYKRSNSSIGINTARDGWKMNFPKGEQVKLNVSVVSEEGRYRIVVFLNGYLFVDQQFTQSQVDQSVMTAFSSDVTNQAIILMGGEQTGRRADFNSIRYKKGVTSELVDQIVQTANDKIASQPQRHYEPIVPEIRRRGPHELIDHVTGRVPNAIEGEELLISKRVGNPFVQKMKGYDDLWSGDEQLWWIQNKIGDKLTFKLPVKKTGTYILEGALTCARNYGIVQFYLDGKPAGKPIDCYEPEIVISTGLLHFGQHELSAGLHRLVLEIQGKNPNSSDVTSGIDYLRLRSVSSTDENQTDQNGYPALGETGEPLNLDFETGTLKDWTASGTAFNNQPASNNSIESRRHHLNRGYQGKYLIAGYELGSGNSPTGKLTSKSFQVAYPWATLLVGGGNSFGCRVKLVESISGKTVFETTGSKKERLSRAVVDLRDHLNKEVHLEIVDEEEGGWGYLNFDHFRFHKHQPGEPTLSINKNNGAANGTHAIEPSEPIVLLPAENLKHFEPFYHPVKIGDKKPEAALKMDEDEFTIRQFFLGHMLTRAKYQNYRLEVQFRWSVTDLEKIDSIWHENRIILNALVRPDHMNLFTAEEIQTRWRDIYEGYHVHLSPFDKKSRPAYVNRHVRGARLNNILVSTDDSSSPNKYKWYPEKRPGSWNKLEVMSHGKYIEMKINGVTTFKSKDATSTSGRVGIETHTPGFAIRKMVIHPYKGP